MSSKAKKPSIVCGLSVVIGIICTSVKLVSVIISASPYEMIHRLDTNSIIPSIWLWNLMGCIMMFLSGMAAGITVNEIKSGKLTLKKEREAYRGGLYFISMFFLSLIHYPLFFACERILISLIISIITVVCATLCAIMWSGISSVACVMMSANAFFSVYIAFINLNILAIN